MAKLGNIFEGDWFMITQTGHTFDSAIDCVGSTFNIIAPCDLELKTQLTDQFGNPYFEGFNNNFMIRFVHCLLTAKPNSIVKKGTIIGTYKVSTDSYPDHVHIALMLAGKWVTFMNYLDRSIKLRLSPAFGNDRKAGRWSYWGDQQLVILPLVKPPTKPPVTPPTEYNPKEDLVKFKADMNKSLDIIISKL